MTHDTKRQTLVCLPYIMLCSTALLCACSLTDIQNTFSPSRPEQVVEGERRQPVYNQRMISKMRSASDEEYGYEQTSGTPDMPPELLAQQPAPAPKQHSSPHQDSQNNGVLFGVSDWFSAKADPMTADNPPAPNIASAPPSPQPDRPTELSTVPPRPDDFEMARTSARAHMDTLKADYEAAQLSRAR